MVHKFWTFGKNKKMIPKTSCKLTPSPTQIPLTKPISTPRPLTLRIYVLNSLRFSWNVENVSLQKSSIPYVVCLIRVYNTTNHTVNIKQKLVNCWIWITSFLDMHKHPCYFHFSYLCRVSYAQIEEFVITLRKDKKRGYSISQYLCRRWNLIILWDYRLETGCQTTIEVCMVITNAVKKAIMCNRISINICISRVEVVQHIWTLTM